MCCQQNRCLLVFALLFLVGLPTTAQAHFLWLFVAPENPSPVIVSFGEFPLTLVCDSKNDEKPTDTATSHPQEDKLPTLPVPISSFGAAVHDGWLYVYSGHTGRAHEHTNQNLSNHFVRIPLQGGQNYETLPMEDAIQGFPLVQHGNSLYRIGGMFAKNDPGEAEELYSLFSCSRFDTTSQEWLRMPPLPVGRSSHDAVVVDDKLYVGGGWHLNGSDEGDWHNTVLEFDLSDSSGDWQVLTEQPFERRALALAHWNGKLVLLGGIDSSGSISFDCDFYDFDSKSWEKGPSLPGEGISGFGVSAWNHQGQLYLSGAEGILYQLSQDGTQWENVGEVKNPRFFHRLLPANSDQLLIVGGASVSEARHLDDIELIDLK